MKKFILPLMAVGFIFAGTSCKKSYTCNCAGITTTAEFSKKADAEAWCETGSAGLCELE